MDSETQIYLTGNLCLPENPSEMLMREAVLLLYPAAQVRWPTRAALGKQPAAASSVADTAK